MPKRRGVLAFVVLLTVLGTGLLMAAIALRRPSAMPSAAKALVWDVPIMLPEADPPASSFGWASFRRERPTVFEVTEGIRRAASDDQVEALILHIDALDWGWAKVNEVRSAVSTFRRAGKPVYASLRGGSEPEYLLATASSRVALAPTATLQLDGLSATAMFLRGAYDKLGIRPNFEHVGQFKSAAESYTRTSMSEPARAALDTLLGDTYALLIDSLAVGRKLSAPRVREVLDGGPWLAKEALAQGLVDTLLDEAELDSSAVRRGAKRLAPMSFNRWLRHAPARQGGAKVALVTVAGAIVGGKSSEDPWGGRQEGSETVVAALRDARTRESVRGIVVRVDSPGGSGEASDEIWQEIRRCRATKPIVVSMSDYAASGGYYVASAATAVVAQPGTITGSIGVFGGKLNLRGLYEKLGLNIETVTRGRHAEMLSPFRDFTPEESQRFRTGLEEFYRTFLSRVATGRQMDTAFVDSVGQGRVWSGRAALAHGLVDQLGGFEQAFDRLRMEAGLEPGEPLAVEVFPRARRSVFAGALSDLLDEEEQDTEASILADVFPVEVRAWLAAAKFPAGAVFAMLPYTLRIR